jgi:hypothetical protein
MKGKRKSTESYPKFGLFGCKAEQDEMNNRAMGSARTKYDIYVSKKLLST